MTLEVQPPKQAIIIVNPRPFLGAGAEILQFVYAELRDVGGFINRIQNWIPELSVESYGIRWVLYEPATGRYFDDIVKGDSRVLWTAGIANEDGDTFLDVRPPQHRQVEQANVLRRWIGLKTELKVAVVAGLFGIVVAIVTGIFNLGVAIYNGFKVSSTPTPVVSAAPVPIATPTPNPPTRDMNQPIVAVAHEVKIGDEIFLRDRDENYVTAADISPTGNNWPRLEKTGKVTLKLLGNGQVRNDSLVRIQSLEQKLNQKNVLFADSPACRYEKDESDVGRQTWKIVKDDASDPVLHYGDRFYLENKNMRLSENGIFLTIEKEGLRWWILEKK
jgi:hypothetical protein